MIEGVTMTESDRCKVCGGKPGPGCVSIGCPHPFDAPGDPDAHARPHPIWKPSNGSDRHPQTVEEWDYRADPVGGAFERSLHRLNVAGDYDDPRAPDEMALVLRIDLIRLIHDWHHKNAVFEIWREERTKDKS